MAHTRWLISLVSITGLLALVGCNSDPSDIDIVLAPEIVSSVDGSLGVEVTVYHDADATDAKPVTLSVEYVDRNGVDRAASATIEAATGTTDKRGVYKTTISGLLWDGAGTVHVTSGDVTSDAMFAVLDRTPPSVSIVPPTVSAQNDATVTVHVADEIGVSQVSFETASSNGNNGNRQRTTIAQAGLTDADVEFDINGGNLQQGDQLTIYAIAADLSGNQGVATPVTVTVGP